MLETIDYDTFTYTEMNLRKDTDSKIKPPIEKPKNGEKTFNNKKIKAKNKKAAE